jgi:iron complex outermembrane receptor protein/vitamin B12 transporter
MQMEERAKQMIRTGKASCVIAKGGEIVRSAAGKGIAPLLSFYEREPEILKGADVFDRVVGKAAAMIIILGGAGKAYGKIMSAPAAAYLVRNGCAAEYERQIDFIRNRAGDGLCPLERAVLSMEDPKAGYLLLKETAARLAEAVRKKPARVL